VVGPTTAPLPMIGVSFGRRWERTGIAVVERLHVPTGETVVRGQSVWATIEEVQEVQYHVRHLERHGPGAMYSRINRRIVEMVEEISAPMFVVVDVTATGSPLWASLRAGLKEVLTGFYTQRVKPGVFRITGLEGGVVAGADNVISVPRRDLVSTMQLLLEEGRFKIAEDLDLASTLRREMADFKIKVDKHGKEDLESWREGSHDDLVLTVALSAWAGERFFRSKAAPVYSF
jgi:hypothetical protein